MCWWLGVDVEILWLLRAGSGDLRLILLCCLRLLVWMVF